MGLSPSATNLSVPLRHKDLGIAFHKMPQRNDPHTHQHEMKFAHGQVRSKQV
jgi:hypothetical protein